MGGRGQGTGPPGPPFRGPGGPRGRARGQARTPSAIVSGLPGRRASGTARPSRTAASASGVSSGPPKAMPRRSGRNTTGIALREEWQRSDRLQASNRGAAWARRRSSSRRRISGGGMGGGASRRIRRRRARRDPRSRPSSGAAGGGRGGSADGGRRSIPGRPRRGDASPRACGSRARGSCRGRRRRRSARVSSLEGGAFPQARPAAGPSSFCFLGPSVGAGTATRRRSGSEGGDALGDEPDRGPQAPRDGLGIQSLRAQRLDGAGRHE